MTDACPLSRAFLLTYVSLRCPPRDTVSYCLMRPAFILTIVLAVAVLIGIAALVRRSSNLAASPPAVVETSSPAAPGANSDLSNPAPAEVASSPAAAAAPAKDGAAEVPAPGAANHSEYVKTRIAQLQDLSMENDAASLNTILSELNNRDPEIRSAAVEAAIQFGSRDAIPALMEAATHTDDPQEKKEMIDAAEFLKLPSLTEVMAQQGKKAASQPAKGKGRPAPPVSTPK